MDLTLPSPRIPSLPTCFFSVFSLPLPPSLNFFFLPARVVFLFFLFEQLVPLRKRKKERKKRKTPVGSDYTAGLLLICVPAVQSAHTQCASRLSRADFGVGRPWLFKLEVGSHLLLPHSGSQPSGKRGGEKKARETSGILSV